MELIGSQIQLGRVLERLILVCCAPLLIYVGYKLFSLGISGQMQLRAELKDNIGLRLTNLSPGSLCFVLAIAIAAVSYYRPLHLATSEQEEASAQQQRGGAPTPADAVKASASNDQRRDTGQIATKETSARPATKKSQMEFEYEGGTARGSSGLTLGTDLRRGLSEVALCQLSHPTAGGNDCYASTGYFDKFIKIPVDADLTRIEQVEGRIRENPTSGDALTYANYKRVFLKGAAQ